MNDGDITALHSIPIRRSSREDIVEHGGLESGNQEAGPASIATASFSGQQRPGARDVLAVATESLVPEAIGQSDATRALQAGLRLCGGVWIDVPQGDPKAVAAQLPGPQFVPVPAELIR